MAEKLKKIDCCWRCNKNNACDREKVCKLDRPFIKECRDCDTYKNFSPCPDFVSKIDWQFDMTKCPDCGMLQKLPKKDGDRCENFDCCSEVVTYTYKGKKTDSRLAKLDGHLMWTNENWD